MVKNINFNKLSNELRYLRGNEKKKHFANKIGVSYRTYLRYESGEINPKEPVMKVARKESKNKEVEGVREANEEYIGSSNPMSQVIKGIKEIYDSKNIVLIQAFTLNIAAFQLAVKLSSEQKKELKELHDTCKEILERILVPEQQLKGRILGETKSQEDIGKKAAT